MNARALVAVVAIAVAVSTACAVATAHANPVAVPTGIAAFVGIGVAGGDGREPERTIADDATCPTCFMPIELTRFSSEKDATPEHGSGTWADVRRRLCRFETRSEKSGAAWSPAVYAEGATRANASVEYVTIAVADVDDGSDPTAIADRLAGLGLEFLVHSTFSSTPAHPKYRVVVPLAHAIPGSEWGAYYPRIVSVLVDGHGDPSTKDPARLFFIPTVRPGAEPWIIRAHGRALAESDLPPAAAAVGPRTFTPTGDGKIPHGDHHAYILSTAASLASRTPGATEESLVAQVRAACAIVLDDMDTHDGELRDAVRSALLKYGRPAGPVVAPKLPVVPSETGDPDAPGSKLWSPTGTPVAVAFVDGIMEAAKFAAFSDSRELLVYVDGLYVRGASTLVDAWVEQRFAAKGLTAKAQFRYEVELAVRARCYVPRSSFNPKGMLNVKNGVLVLDGEARLLPHSSALYFTYKIGTPFDPAATCPRFDRFMVEVLPNERHRRLADEFIGYTFEEDNPFQAALVLVGAGGNGKSKFLGVAFDLLGEENVSAETLQSIAGGTFAVAELYGKRANVCADIPDTPLRQTSAFKQLTGGDPISAQKKHRDPFKFVWGGKALFSCNRLPEVEDNSFAFFRRWYILPFNVTFSGTDADDPNLSAKLRAEAPGILNRAIRSLSALRARGRFDADTVSEDREEWARRANTLRWFISERVVADRLAFTVKGAFMSEYGEFCAARQVAAKTVSEVGAQIARWIPGAASSGHRQPGKGLVRCWDGFRLKPEGDDDGDEPAPGDGNGGGGGVTPVTADTPLSQYVTHAHARAPPILDPPVTPVTGVTVEGETPESKVSPQRRKGAPGFDLAEREERELGGDPA